MQKLMEVGNDFVSRMLHRELVAFPQAEAVVATDVCELLDLLLHGAPDFRSVVGSRLQNDAWHIRLSRECTNILWEPVSTRPTSWLSRDMGWGEAVTVTMRPNTERRKGRSIVDIRDV